MFRLPPLIILSMLDACVELPRPPTADLDPFGQDASVTVGLSTDAGTRPPPAPPYDGPECDSTGSQPHPMDGPGPDGPDGMEGPVQEGDEPILMEPGMMDGQDSQGTGSVAPTAAGQLVITELMTNPAALSDTMGEWIELFNPTEHTLDLSGCELMDGDQGRPLPDGFGIAAGTHAVLARADAPGLSPAALVTFTLNNGGDRIGVTCGGVEIDVVEYSSEFPLQAGASTALSADAYDAVLNDQAGAWCPGTSPYATDLGTPGALNGRCGSGAGSADEDAGI